jgi:hypothetical protein
MSLTKLGRSFMLTAKLPSTLARLLPVLLIMLLAVRGVQAQATVDVIVFRSPDSLTLYFLNPPPVNISGLYIEATTATGNNLRQVLENLPAFRGLPYDRLPTPLCFRMIRTSSDDPLALECQTTTTLSQTLIDANVFWYDRVAQQDRTLLLYLGAEVAICPAETPRCDLSFPTLPTATLSPTDTISTTPTPTDTLIFTQMPDVLQLALSFGGTNDDWTPVVRYFDGVPMVLVPAGCFDMGDHGEGGRQCFDAPFWIDKTEVTQADFERLGGLKASPNGFDDDQRPVENITWLEARDFCMLRRARLPTEAEWEYAARGPDNLAYPWGNIFVPDNAVYGENSGGQTENVGRYQAGESWVGALDMSGNVWEWVSTVYTIDYPYDPNDGRENMQNDNSGRVLRGGGWSYIDPSGLRASFRNWDSPFNKGGVYGFRCVHDT